MLRSPSLAALVVFISLAGTPVAAQLTGNGAAATLFPAPRTVAADSAVPKPRMAIAQTLLVNIAVNRVDAHLLGHDWAWVTPTTWSRNLRLGWTWDDDDFLGNMFAHPVHGALYFNSGRANNLHFWESVPLTFLGSWSWEYFGEIKRPSLNDFFMTSFGGIAMGEVLHRVGASIRDNTLTGRSRRWREIAAFPIDFVGSVNRLINGEWSAIAANPPEHAPDAFLFRLSSGVRFADGGVEDPSERLTPAGTVYGDLRYGDSFTTEYKDPFDVFSVQFQLSPGQGDLNMVRASGRLFSMNLNGASHRHRHILAINQRYDYLRNPAHLFGAQSVEGGLYSRWTLTNSSALRTQAFASGVVMAAIDAPSSGSGDRTYDFGPGAGFRLRSSYERGGITYATIEARTDYVRTVSGAAADHHVSMGGVEVTIPIARELGVGLYSGYYNRLSRYSDREDESRESPEVRLTIVWTAKARSPLGK